MRFISVSRSLGAIALASLALTAVPARAATYDAVADFQIAANPGGVWSYGYSHDAGPSYSMIQFDDSASTSGWLSWTKAGYVSLGTPTAAKNISGSTISGALSGQLILHPGPAANADYAILRFTAPVTATYDVVGQFYAGDIGSMSGSVVLGGDLANPLQFFSNTTDASTFSFSSLMLTQGETLDLAVGNNGNYFYGTTPVSMTITTAVPEPSSVALMFAGAAMVAWALRRRPVGVRPAPAAQL
ncbi:MAG: PEP-CTERM sorting domain-containing protein [Proteobacteria bacterium]|nr:PEP-CTERM sorting domain-containing protein [Pseudomonadota bacterium]